nr:NAD(P)-binding protein [bacterium]
MMGADTGPAEESGRIRGERDVPFLIVGSGIAGLYTALKLAQRAEVTLLTKDRLEESNTTYA